jgi:V-type H+-transporting ATPase subunit H
LTDLHTARPLRRTWDEYESELETGHLKWSPAHESEEFWKENAVKLSERDGRLVRCVLV